MSADVEVTTYPELEQGSPEWLAARCGILTASVIGRLLTVAPLGGIDYPCPDCGAEAGSPCVSVAKRNTDAAAPIKNLHSGRTDHAKNNANTAPITVTPATGDDADRLTHALVAERLTGNVEEQYISPDMYRGMIDEPIARAVYAEHHAPVTEVGFITRSIGQGWRVGYSPDGLVGDDGLIEIKSRRQHTQLRTILTAQIPRENLAQLQCGLYVTGRKWIDYVSFCAGMPLYVQRVHPDPQWQPAIEAAVALFEANAATMTARYQQLTAGLPVTERTPDIPEMTVPQ